jgi:hypothetical protein
MFGLGKKRGDEESSDQFGGPTQAPPPLAGGGLSLEQKATINQAKFELVGLTDMFNRYYPTYIYYVQMYHK